MNIKWVSRVVCSHRSSHGCPCCSHSLTNSRCSCCSHGFSHGCVPRLRFWCKDRVPTIDGTRSHMHLGNHFSYSMTCSHGSAALTMRSPAMDTVFHAMAEMSEMRKISSPGSLPRWTPFFTRWLKWTVLRNIALPGLSRDGIFKNNLDDTLVLLLYCERQKTTFRPPDCRTFFSVLTNFG